MNRASSRQAFTLIEVLLVIVILGVIAAVAVTQLDIFGTTEGAKRDATEVSIGKLTTAVETFRLHMGRLPRSLDELVNDPGDPDWRGPYQKKIPQDLWGDAYLYSSSGNTFEIRSNAGGSADGPISSNDLF